MLANDNDPDGDPLTVTVPTQPTEGTVVVNPNGTLTFTPNAGVSGPVTFTYMIDDGMGGTDTATVTIDVTNEPTGLAPQPQVPTIETEDSVLTCLLYTSPSPRDLSTSRMPSSA